jgi:SAM-dependent methyltransferase
MTTAPHPYPVEVWHEDHVLRDATFEYWNDESVELDKVWNIEQRDGFARMERYLDDVGLSGALESALRRAAEHGRPLRGVGADLACGTCWAAARLLSAGPVERLYCVEYSSPRLLRFAPKVLAHYGVPPERVRLCVASFYELRLPAASLDFVFLSQAFHHADRPAAMLAEIARVLKPGGVAIVIGEHVVPSLAGMYARHVPRAIAARVVPRPVQRRLLGRDLARKPLLATPRQLLAPDPVTGDHFYRMRDYAALFSEAGFSFEPVRDGSKARLGFVLMPS